MQPITTENRSTAAQPIRKITEPLRDAAESFISDLENPEIQATPGEVASQLEQEVVGLEQNVDSWLSQNYGKAFGILGVLTAVGTLGYFFGRRSIQSERAHSLNR